ncbi:hypothetical protein Xsto_03998 [Xenorhabdus stockiae]|uniref:Uncharacterized protein n=1 Tax=Xenorhabdus stockiae TaxID=351614 RepID=A0A2D0KAS4_9GAMM|nr:hypothetical protein Xsto_03998 [Xenorhabdus stockiae]
MKTIRWFLSDRWVFKECINILRLDPNHVDEVVDAYFHNNVCGCRDNSIIYNDIRRIARAFKK